MKIDNIKNEFLIFDNNKDVIFFDSSSTTQKPKVILEKINAYVNENYSNANRGSYRWANYTNKLINNTRRLVREFINANSEEEIAFTSGATESAKEISYLYGISNLTCDDEILLCYDDHRSTVEPWINTIEILKKFDVNVKVVPIILNQNGEYDEEDLYGKINKNTKLVILTHINNVVGLKIGIERIVTNIKKINKNTLICLDISQSIGKIRIDLQSLGIDIAYFSGHKMFALSGTGILWVKKEIINKLNNKNFDVESLSNVLEKGTQNITGIISLGEAIKFINEIGIDEIDRYLIKLTQYLVSKLRDIEDVIFCKGAGKCSCGTGHGIVSFKIKNISSLEVSEVLNSKNIFIRSGKHCLYYSNDDKIRISLHIYNTKEEIDKFITILKEILEVRE